MVDAMYRGDHAFSNEKKALRESYGFHLASADVWACRRRPNGKGA